jgi:hypothetical protein
MSFYGILKLDNCLFFQSLRHYLSEYHTEYEVKDKPKVLLRALERSIDKKWIVRVSGKGMSGRFRLAFPYCPSPKDLWREAYNENDYKKSSGDQKSEGGDEESSDDEEIEDEVPVKKSRGDPKKRSAPLKTAKKASKRGSTLQKPTKKAPTSSKRDSTVGKKPRASPKRHSTRQKLTEKTPTTNKRRSAAQRVVTSKSN